MLPHFEIVEQCIVLVSLRDMRILDACGQGISLTRTGCCGANTGRDGGT